MTTDVDNAQRASNDFIKKLSSPTRANVTGTIPSTMSWNSAWLNINIYCCRSDMIKTTVNQLRRRGIRQSSCYQLAKMRGARERFIIAETVQNQQQLHLRHCQNHNQN
jgi:hypothetical protein